MQCYQRAGEDLRSRRPRRRQKSEEHWMYYDRTEVFDKEDCTPCYLRTKILYIYSALVAEAGLGDGHVGAVGDEASIATFNDP